MSEEERSAIAWLESAVADGLEWHRGKQLTYPKPTPDPTPNPHPSPNPNPDSTLSLIVIIAQL